MLIEKSIQEYMKKKKQYVRFRNPFYVLQGAGICIKNIFILCCARTLTYGGGTL